MNVETTCRMKIEKKKKKRRRKKKKKKRKEIKEICVYKNAIEE